MGGALADEAASRTEIDENGCLIRGQQDVGRLDIAVQVLLSVEVVQSAEQGGQFVDEPGFLECVAGRMTLFQAFTTYHRHDVVGGAESMECFYNRYDIRVRELGEQFCLMDEVFKRPVEGILRVIGIIRDNAHAAPYAMGVAWAEIFFDHAVALSLAVVCLIGDAETSMPQNFPDNVLTELAASGEGITEDLGISGHGIIGSVHGV